MKTNAEKTVRVRFAPSPTGLLHVGTARAGLFNYLYAKNQKGVMVFRSEDTDRERSKEEYELDIMRSIEWLGLSWEEGITQEGEKGNYGPYRQSERGEIYKKNIIRLIENKKAYYCFCDKDALDKMREEQRKNKKPPKYEGKCSMLSEKEREKYLTEKRDFVIRLFVPENEKIIFDDKIRGKVEFNSNDIGGDFVIARKDFSPLYNFACAVDDIEMEITHVIRGEDHISNTPKQILVQKALEKPSPKFAHLPLLLGEDKSKLSKRHGATSLGEYQKMGYLPEAVINFIALLGWHPGGSQEIYSLEEIIKKFSLKNCQKSGAVFDIKKLDYINGFYLRKKDLKELTNLCIPYLIEKNLIQENGNFYKITETNEMIEKDYIMNIVALYQERLKKLSEIGEFTDYFFKKELAYDKSLLIWKSSTEEEVVQALEKIIKKLSSLENWSKETVEKALLDEAEKIGDRGLALWPTRVALTGKRASAGPFDILPVLGPEKSLKRLKTAKNKLKT